MARLKDNEIARLKSELQKLKSKLQQFLESFKLQAEQMAKEHDR
jgi:uncharacterized phage infection (PIP) family protein YhgE